MSVNRPTRQSPPLWLLAELTYACPLQCAYCSNPVDFARHGTELDTDQWLRVLTEARALGVVQLGLSGGEPTVRQDLETIIAGAARLGFYSNLITAAAGLDPDRLTAFKAAGLDHVQVSFSAADQPLNDLITGSASFAAKLAIAREVKRLGYPMVLCFVLHQANIHQIDEVLRLSEQLGADTVELATTQYYGWALQNRAALLPSREQLKQAEATVNAWRQRHSGTMQVLYVVPDYYEDRPKPCMNGWGSMYLVVTPDGVALPCNAARDLPGEPFPSVREHGLQWIWQQSPQFQRYRGEDWMQPPCRDCPERSKDFGGCRCQAYLLTGDPANADPVCSKSPFRQQLNGTIESAINERRQAGPSQDHAIPWLARNPRNSKRLSR